MRILTSLQAFGAAATIASLVGCSGGSAIAPNPASPQSINARTPHHFESFYACPATGPIKYVSDPRNNVINIYVGKFAGQSPCGQIASSKFNGPAGLHVKVGTHDLYVANISFHNILVFHRGQMNPYNTYTDPSAQVYPLDVTVATDGTVIAVDTFTIATWIGGPNGGTFVGVFPAIGDLFSVAAQRNGTVYFDGQLRHRHGSAIWSASCPAGACGPQTKVITLSSTQPGGMAIDATGDLLMNDTHGSLADTFELPNKNPRTFPLMLGATGMAINPLDHHWFTANQANGAFEYSYPSGKLIGAVPANFGGFFQGIAVDP
jgi:hypothetical protein